MNKCSICNKTITPNQVCYVHQYPFEKLNKQIQYTHVSCEEKFEQNRVQQEESEADWDE